MAQIVGWHLQEHAPPLRTLAPDMPPDVERLVHRALDKDPAKRPTMRALTDGLRDALAILRAPQRRSARNVPLPGQEFSFAPTIPMSVSAEPDRAAVLPPVPPAPPAPPPASPPRESTPSMPRSTDIPVESVARASRVTPKRRAPMAALAAGIVILATAATGWMIYGRTSLAPAPASPPRPAAPVSPPPSASAPAPPPAKPRSSPPPVTSASASARPSRPRPPSPPAPAHAR